MTGYCPQCGAARLGAFRYCQNCQLDYDTLAADWSERGPSSSFAPPPAVGPIAAGQSARRSTGRRVLGIGIALVFGLAAIDGWGCE